MKVTEALLHPLVGILANFSAQIHAGVAQRQSAVPQAGLDLKKILCPPITHLRQSCFNISIRILFHFMHHFGRHFFKNCPLFQSFVRFDGMHFAFLLHLHRMKKTIASKKGVY